MIDNGQIVRATRVCHRQSPCLLHWAADLIIGYLAIAPLILIGYVLENTILLQLGLSDGSSTFNDGMAIPLGLALIGLIPLALIFVGINGLLFLRSGAPGFRYWLVNSMIVFIPFIVAYLVHAVWDFDLWSPYAWAANR